MWYFNISSGRAVLAAGEPLFFKGTGNSSDVQAALVEEAEKRLHEFLDLDVWWCVCQTQSGIFRRAAESMNFSASESSASMWAKAHDEAVDARIFLPERVFNEFSSQYDSMFMRTGSITCEAAVTESTGTEFLSALILGKNVFVPIDVRFAFPFGAARDD